MYSNSANYGPVTINKSVTITSEGAVAGVLAASGVGITIAAGASDVVNLRGLDIDGGFTGSVGIQFTSGQSLNIQKTVVRGFSSSGINFAPNAASSLYVGDTTLTNNRSNGILITSSGSGAINGALNRVTASANGVGIFAANGTGWQTSNGGQVLIYSNNNVSGNGTDGTLTSTLAL